jgi:hypothetical protein
VVRASDGWVKSMSLIKALCGIGSVLICVVLGTAFYHLVGKRGLGSRDTPETETVPAGFTGTVQHDDGSFRMVENINFSSSGYSLFSVLACLVAVAGGGFLLWVLYRKYIDWRASNETTPDMTDLEDMSPPPSYSRAMRNEQQCDARQRSRTRNPRHHPRRGQTHNAYQTEDQPCPHPGHQEPEEEDDWERMPRIRSEESSRTTSPQLPLAPRIRGSDTEARLFYAAASGFLPRHLPRLPVQSPQYNGGGVHINREQQVCNVCKSS